jgi:hypothetical protein
MQQVPTCAGAFQLVKGTVVIYVGSTVNLRKRFLSLMRSPCNPVVAYLGWDSFRFTATRTVRHAQIIEFEWYRKNMPAGNLRRPPVKLPLRSPQFRSKPVEQKLEVKHSDDSRFILDED